MSEIDSTPIYVGAGLEGVPAWLRGQAAACSEELSRLRSQLAPLEASWQQSSAAAYYQIMQENWNTAARGLFDPEVGVLGRIARAMETNVVNYAEGEGANIRTWRH